MIELANETVNEIVKEKPVNLAEQIRKYVTEHPFTQPRNIAKKMGVDRQYVYTVMWNMKNKTKLAKKKATTNEAKVDLTPALKFVEGRAQAQRENWKQLGLFSSNKSVAQQIEMFEPKSDPVNNPTHYTVGGIETIDFIEAKKLGYNLGNVVKYITRSDHKGNKLEDLRKAQWYLTREINSLK